MSLTFGRKPREIGQLSDDYRPKNTTVEDAAGSLTAFMNAEPINRPSPPEPIALNRLDEIAVHLRSLRWEEMMEISTAWNLDAAVLHKWAIER